MADRKRAERVRAKRQPQSKEKRGPRDEPREEQQPEETEHFVVERVYETLPNGRTVLAAVAGDVIPIERARELGLTDDGDVPNTQPPIADPHLLEGHTPLIGAEADARATGDTAEALARGFNEPEPHTPLVTDARPARKPRGRT